MDHHSETSSLWCPGATCPARNPDDDPRCLKVLSYNLQLLPRWMPGAHDPVARARVIPGLIEPGYDVLVFQETFDLGARAELLRGLSEQGYVHHTDPVGLGGLRIGSGVTVASRWPLAQVASITYRRGLPIDWFARKGAIHTALTKGERTYHLFATHLQSSVLLPGSKWVRASQLRALRAFIHEQAPEPDQPVLVAGDLNVDWHDEGEHGSLLDLLDASWPHEPLRPGPGGERAYTFDVRNELMSERTSRWLDYVLISRGHLQPVRHQACVHPYRAPWGRRGVSDLSDHFALSLCFDFP